MKNSFIILLITGFAIFHSCHEQKRSNEIILSDETIIDTVPGSCPFLTKDNLGNVVLSWIKHVNTSSFMYCYAISKDNGKTFGKPVEIPSSTNVQDHPENLPKIIFKTSGEIIAVWGAANPNPQNPYSGVVFHSQSYDEGKHWSPATKLVDDTAGIDQRYFDLALLPNGEAGIIWLDNRMKNAKEGSSLFFATTSGKNGFQQGRKISGPCCECCRTVLFTDRKKNIHVLYRAIINDSIRDMVHSASYDGGQSFTSPGRISNDNWVINGCPHSGPAMAESTEGLHFTWFTAGSGTGIFYDYSADNGHSYIPKESISGRTARHPQIATLSNDEVIIVWDENFQRGDTIYSRIGLEKRDAGGRQMLKKYITPRSSLTTYPVISSLADDKLTVAYCKSIKDESYVFYKTSK